MVNVMVFAPSPDLMEPMRKLAQEYGSDEVNIDVIHRFGTPEILWQLDRYDVIVARGITYNKIRDLYPQKHITQLVFDGLDVLEALRRCRETYHPAHLGLCLDRDQLQDLVPAMEEVCGAKIRICDVQDEETAIRTAETCQADGMDALVSGGTVYNFCQERGVPCTYVHLRMETLRRTLSEAMKAAHSINTERTKSNIIRMILDNSEDAVMAVDESGRVLEANNQAYRLYHLAFLKEWKGQSVEKINDALTFIGSRKSPCRDGDEELVTLDGQRHMVKYRLISGETSAIGTLITTSAASKILQEERQIRRGLVRRGLAAKYSFRDIIAVSDSMRSRVEIAKQFSQANNSNVLITGETGTGKELFAHSIHAAKTPAGPAGKGDPAGGQHHRDPCGCAGHCGHQPGSAAADRKGKIPQRPPLPAQCVGNPHSAPAGASGRYPAAAGASDVYSVCGIGKSSTCLNCRCTGSAVPV